MADCTKCGLFVTGEGKCLWYKKQLSEREVAAGDDCLYFTGIIYEDGEPLSPHQHIMFKQQDVNSKKMQGPV
jgi:hypothetical protein